MAQVHLHLLLPSWYWMHIRSNWLLHSGNKRSVFKEIIVQDCLLRFPQWVSSSLRRPTLLVAAFSLSHFWLVLSHLMTSHSMIHSRWYLFSLRCWSTSSPQLSGQLLQIQSDWLPLPPGSSAASSSSSSPSSSMSSSSSRSGPTVLESHPLKTRNPVQI